MPASRIVLTCCLLAAALAACRGPGPLLADGGWPPIPHCAAVLGVDLEVWTDIDGQVLPEPGRSRRATMLGREALAMRVGTELVDPAPVPALREHLALYDRIADEAIRQQVDPLFAHRRGHLQATLGPGLAGAAPCPLGLVLQGAALPPAAGTPGFLSLGVIRLDDGRVLGIGRVHPGRAALDRPEVMADLVNRLASGLPL